MQAKSKRPGGVHLGFNGWMTVALLIGAGALSACYPVTELQTPTTLEPGHVQVAAGTRMQGATIEHEPTVNLPIPEQCGLRVGVAEGWEIGGRAFNFFGAGGWELGFKHQLIDGELAVAIAPAVTNSADWDGYFDEGGHEPDSEVSLIAMRIPVFVALPRLGSVTPWLAPTIHAGRFLEQGSLTFLNFAPVDSPFLAAGMSVGFELQAKDGLALQPQLGVLVPLHSPEHGFGYALPPGEGRASIRLTRGDVRVELAVAMFMESG